jgi:hypothetical protein
VFVSEVAIQTTLSISAPSFTLATSFYSVLHCWYAGAALFSLWQWEKNIPEEGGVRDREAMEENDRQEAGKGENEAKHPYSCSIAQPSL